MNLFIKDPKINAKSVSVTLLIVSFGLSILSISLSHKFVSCLPASILSLLMFAFCYLMYRLRKVDDFKLNLKTGEVSAEDKEDVKTESVTDKELKE